MIGEYSREFVVTLEDELADLFVLEAATDVGSSRCICGRGRKFLKEEVLDGVLSGMGERIVSDVMQQRGQAVELELSVVDLGAIGFQVLENLAADVAGA